MSAPTSRRLLLTGWLLVVWLLLWGALHWDVVLAGAVVAVAIVRVSNFPYAPRRSRFRLVRLPAFLVRAAVDVVRGSLLVAKVVARRGRWVRSSVLEVPTPHDMTDTAAVLAGYRVSIEPGSLSIEMDRRNHRLFVYQLDTDDADAAEAGRRRLTALVDEVHGLLPPRSPDDEGAPR